MHKVNDLLLVLRRKDMIYFELPWLNFKAKKKRLFREVRKKRKICPEESTYKYKKC